jgi:hypothetical protein
MTNNNLFLSSLLIALVLAWGAAHAAEDTTATVGANSHGRDARATTVPAVSPTVTAGSTATASAAGAASTATAVSASATTVPASARKLVGFWIRADSDPSAPYVIQVKSVGGDGMLDAAYYNPRPIHVARAELTTKDGKPAVYVEMRDRNYPGSNYNLVFHETEDALVGKYFQAIEGQTFDVMFSRMKK